MRSNLIVLIFFFLHICWGNTSKSNSNTETTKKATPPNILWITIEDWSQDLSCYGTKGIYTPNVDKLASQGVRYNNAFTTSPVCSTSRSAMMTGFHQNYIGANQHRTSQKKALPYGIKPIPIIFKENGYFTSLMSWKVDCNFIPNKKNELFMDQTDFLKTGEVGWRKRAKGQPFFARITFQSTHRAWKRDPLRPISINNVEIPPYYADTDFVKRDWANGLEQMQIVDRQVGNLLQKLEDDGLAENTIVFFISDHGGCHIRGKQFLYDGGIKIPMIVRWPQKIKPKSVSNEMVMAIDLCATALAAANIKEPVALHGKNLLSDEVKNRKYIFAARDKMDETHDAMRAIRSKEYKLIHNLMPNRPYLQYNKYKEGAYPALTEMNILFMENKLTPDQAKFFASHKPEFELFDLKKDIHELNNVADKPKYKKVKKELLKVLTNWRKNTIKDQGITDIFKAATIFPKQNPYNTVDEWVFKNQNNYNFKKHGWPAWYPTRSLEAWKKAREKWVPYVFREADSKVKRPTITLNSKHKKKKKKKH